MDKIKTLVRYDANEMTIWDADDESLGFFTPDGSDVDAIGNQIANALNNAADQSRVIEVMRTALEHYGEKDFWCPREDGEDNDGADWWLGSTDGYTPALDALAEAQRIMEGK